MKIFRTVATLRRFLVAGTRPIVLVPTMGALHSGHEALVRRARKLAGNHGTVIVTLFVNPTQFGPGEDFSKYPRTFSADKKLCLSAGADIIFSPAPTEMYKQGASTFVDETTLSLPLCGSSRPGHFRGVCTVVAKLFHIVSPDTAVFGEKDWQQLAVIRRMVRDLDFPVKIISHPIVREESGLALSSRNSYLTPARRTEAASIYNALRAAAKDKSATPAEIIAHARRAIQGISGATIDYLEIRDAETLALSSSKSPRRGNKLRLFVAVRLDGVRLIDNIAI